MLKSITCHLRVAGGTNKCLSIDYGHHSYSNNGISLEEWNDDNENNGDQQSIGTDIQEWDCDGSDAQTFTMVPLSSGYYSVVSSKGFCLDVTYASTNNGTIVQLWSCNGNTNQMWSLIDLGNNLFHLKPVHAIQQNMCLDNSNGLSTNGNTIQICKCNSNSDSQVWSIAVPVVSGIIVYLFVYLLYLTNLIIYRISFGRFTYIYHCNQSMFI